MCPWANELLKRLVKEKQGHVSFERVKGSWQVFMTVVSTGDWRVEVAGSGSTSSLDLSVASQAQLNLSALCRHSQLCCKDADV